MSNEPELIVLSLGWGVQSSTLAAMAALGEIPPVDFAVHADTSWEYQATYSYAELMTPWLEVHGVRVRTVQSPRVKVVEKWKSRTEGVMVPAFTLSPQGKEGQLARQCTSTWKIRELRRFAAAELHRRGLTKRPGSVMSLQGISYDEWHRMRTSDIAYVVNDYPLVDRKMTRQDCINWLVDNGLQVPQKSSCVFCPYHSKAEWERLPRRGGEDWETAVSVDLSIRNKRDKFPLFVHPSAGR